MSEAPDRTRRLEGIISKHEQKVMWLSTLIVAMFVVLALLSAWILKDKIGASQIVLVPMLTGAFLYLAFSIYSFVIWIVTPNIKSDAPVKTRIVYLHGAAVLIVGLLSVAGSLIAIAYKQTAF